MSKKYFNKPSKTQTDPNVCSPLQAALRGARGEYVASNGRQALPSGDYSNFPTDLPSAMMVVKNAEQTFAQLPAVVRQRFGNNPGELSSFIEMTKNSEEFYNEGVRLGLLNKKSKPTTTTPQNHSTNNNTPPNNETGTPPPSE